MSVGMAQPSHIVVAQDQTVWMSDPTLTRLVQFNLNGLFLTSLPRPRT